MVDTFYGIINRKNDDFIKDKVIKMMLREVRSVLYFLKDEIKKCIFHIEKNKLIIKTINMFI